MKKILLTLFVLGVISCQPAKEKKTEPNMEFGGWSGNADDHAMESLMTRKIMDNYSSNNLMSISDLISDTADEFYFNNTKVTKQGWLEGASAHHNYFDGISNKDKLPYNVTTTVYENGSTWSLAWFLWTGTGKFTGTEAEIYVHHGFRWEEGKIVAAYHFFDPTLINNEIAAASEK